VSDEENKMTPQATPAWMQSQNAKPESTPPKSRRPRRTKAQMAEARAAALGTESIIPASAVDQISDDTVRVRAVERARPSEIVRSYLPTAIALVALALAVAAHVR
jgi:hypothetical protein